MNGKKTTNHAKKQASKKPPTGLTPQWVWNNKRLQDIKDAIHRYMEAEKEIDPEWIEEYNQIIENGYY